MKIRYEVGSRVEGSSDGVSGTGHFGTIEAINGRKHFAGGKVYVVRWDNTGETKRHSCMSIRPSAK